MTVEELTVYRKNSYESMKGFYTKNPEKLKKAMKAQYRKNRLANNPGFLRASLFSKVYAFKNLIKHSQETKFMPEDALMGAMAALNNLNMRIENY